MRTKLPVFLALFLTSLGWADTYTDNGNGTVTLTPTPQVVQQVIDPIIIAVQIGQLQQLQAKTQNQIVVLQTQLSSIYSAAPELQPVQAQPAQGQTVP